MAATPTATRAPTSVRLSVKTTSRRRVRDIWLILEPAGLQAVTLADRAYRSADRAVGWWYPAASMLAHQDTEAAADLTYQWGGMGHDGYQQPAPGGIQIPLAAQGTEYGFQPGLFYLLDSNAVIKTDQSQFSGAHSDIRHPEVVWAVVAASH